MKDTHSLAKILRDVHFRLWKLPGELHSLATLLVTETGDDSAYPLSIHIESITELLNTTTNLLEEICKEHESIVLEQIARLLLFVAEFKLKAGWRFVQLSDYMRDIRRKEKNNQRFKQIADECSIPDRRDIYIHEFANLMSGTACHLESLFLNMSLPIMVAMSSFDNPEKLYAHKQSSQDNYNPEKAYSVVGRSPEDYALGSLISSLKNAAQRLRNYDVSEHGRKEFLVAGQVLELRYELDEAKHLLVHCENLIRPELLEKAQVAVNVLWDYSEELSFELIAALWIPPGLPDLPMSMDTMVKNVSAKFARANERRILLEELAGQLEVALETKSRIKSVKGPLQENETKITEADRRTAESQSEQKAEPAETERPKPGKEPKKKKRPTKADMKKRNSAVLVAATKLQDKYGQLPSVYEIQGETGYTPDQIYSTIPYKEGKIAKKSAKLTTESTGSSVVASEQYKEKSIEHSRADRLSKTEQLERDRLIDESRADEANDEKQYRRYLRNKKKIDADH